MSGRVGVITTCYNEERFIETCIRSVDKQTYSDWYHIVLDDGSTDNTASIVERFSQYNDKRKFISQNNIGQNRSRNKGFENLPEDIDYVIFLDGDDYLRSNALEIGVSYLESNSQVSVLTWVMILINEFGDVISDNHIDYYSQKRPRFGKRTVPTMFWMRDMHSRDPYTSIYSILSDCISTPTRTLMTYDSFRRSDGFTRSSVFRAGGADKMLFAKLAKNETIHHINQGLTYHRIHDDQVTSNRSVMKRQHKLLMRRLHNMTNELEGNDRMLLIDALCFYELRYRLPEHARGAKDQMVRGKYVNALRILFGVAWRYVLSLFPSKVAYHIVKDRVSYHVNNDT